MSLLNNLINSLFNTFDVTWYSNWLDEGINEISDRWISRTLIPVLTKLLKIGSPRQMKHGIRCIERICPDYPTIFQLVFDVRFRHHYFLVSNGIKLLFYN